MATTCPCASLPQTVVHGDFSALNIRVVPSPDGPAVYVFDWEKSGQGMIAVDFVRGLNIDAYHAIVREAWPQIAREDVERMAAYGRIMRLLTHNWSKKAVPKIEDYYNHMNEAMRALGWKGGAGK